MGFKTNGQNPGTYIDIDRGVDIDIDTEIDINISIDIDIDIDLRWSTPNTYYVQIL